MTALAAPAPSTTTNVAHEDLRKGVRFAATEAEAEFDLDDDIDIDDSVVRSTSSPSTTTKKGVHFNGVAIRYFARSLGDNPAAQGGPPLGLDWKFMDLTLSDNDGDSSSLNTDDIERTEHDLSGNSNHSFNSSTSSFPHDVIPIDEFEREANKRRKKRLMQVYKLQQKSKKQIEKMEKALMRQASTGNVFSRVKINEGDKEDLLHEDQMKQLSAKWLKLQPVPGQKREKIILLQTKTTKSEMDKIQKELSKIRHSRKTTIAMAETGMDDWIAIMEVIKRRFRRMRTGISKEKEQELLWEQAKEYFQNMDSSRDSSENNDNDVDNENNKNKTTAIGTETKKVEEDYSTVSLRTTDSHEETAPLSNAIAA